MDTLLRPLEGFDFVLYDKYHAGIDFLLFLPLLIFIARTSLGRMFPGENGERLGTAVGVILAVSLAIAEQTLGFSLKSFGPVAAGLIAFTVALVIYNFMRHAGAGHLMCSSVALIVTYLSMRVAVPGFFLWAKTNEWAGYLHALVVLAVLVAIWRFIQALFTSEETRTLGRVLKRTSEDTSGSIDIPLRKDMAEWRLVHGRLAKLTAKGRRESKKVIIILREIIDIIRDHGADERTATDICHALGRLTAREHVLFLRLNRIENTNRKLTRFDLSMYKDLQARYRKLTKEQQLACNKLLAQETDKLGVEKRIAELTTRGRKYEQSFGQCLTRACELLKAGRTGDAKEWLVKGVNVEHEAAVILEEIDRAEKTLEAVIEKQVATIEALQKE